VFKSGLVAIVSIAYSLRKTPIFRTKSIILFPRNTAVKRVSKNLAWACFDCNRFKGSDISSLDPVKKELTRLFNPRIDLWSEHFQESHGLIQAKTTLGSVTERLLKLNLPARVEIRYELTLSGRYPKAT
jgi:hypothetical protein